MRGSLILIFLIYWSSQLFGQGSISFEAYADARQVIKGNVFEVFFTLKNGNGKNFSAPSFKDFRVVSGPNQSVSTSIINGDVSKELTLSYLLMPNKPGTFTIGSASVLVGKKTYKTQPIKIEVLDQAASAKKSKSAVEPIFLVAEVSDSTPFVGQQVVLHYKIYTTKDIDSYNLLSESSYAGLYFEEIKRFDARVQREVINGKQYSTKILKSVALFPQQTGLISVDPLMLQLGVVAENQDPRRSLFFFRDVEMVSVGSNPVNLRVESLPPDAPDNFSGGIGRYSIQLSTKSRQITTDDVLEISLRVDGNGDPKRLSIPTLELPENFELFDPKITEETFRENGGEMVFHKVIQYFAAPREPGNFTIQPAFCYFDLDSMRFSTLRPEAFEVSVLQGSGAGSAQLREATAAGGKDLRPIKTTTSLKPKGSYFLNSGLFWLVFSMPLFGFLISFWYQNQQEKKGLIDPVLLKSRQADKVATKRLALAEQFMQNKDSRHFYDEISKAIFGYICDKLQIPFSELTKSNIRQKLSNSGVTEATTQQVMEIIQTCEMALFAGKDNSESMAEVYQSAKQAIVLIEDQLKNS